MSEVKPIFVRLPTELTRQIRHDAVNSEQSLTEWFREAALDRLRKREEASAE